mmetsp:Transcript_47721/g.152411  ORF Transcript_47721/g.152411 Transcript_47721/m.152411 type:complete len:188 (+) Transcript_47721:1491-2054(+)
MYNLLLCRETVCHKPASLSNRTSEVSLVPFLIFPFFTSRLVTCHSTETLYSFWRVNPDKTPVWVVRCANLLFVILFSNPAQKNSDILVQRIELKTALQTTSRLKDVFEICMGHCEPVQSLHRKVIWRREHQGSIAFINCIAVSAEFEACQRTVAMVRRELAGRIAPSVAEKARNLVTMRSRREVSVL